MLLLLLPVAGTLNHPGEVTNCVLLVCDVA